MIIPFANMMLWNLTFGEDKARSRTGHGPAKMATVRHFDFNTVRSVDVKRSLKLRCNKAARNQAYMALIIGQAC